VVIFNLEYHTEVILAIALRQLRGAALVIGGVDGCHGTGPRDVSVRAKREGYTLVKVFRLRMHIEAAGPSRYCETVDFAVYAENFSRARD
jgi:hypothetical protein